MEARVAYGTHAAKGYLDAIIVQLFRSSLAPRHRQGKSKRPEEYGKYRGTEFSQHYRVPGIPGISQRQPLSYVRAPLHCYWIPNLASKCQVTFCNTCVIMTYALRYEFKRGRKDIIDALEASL